MKNWKWEKWKILSNKSEIDWMKDEGNGVMTDKLRTLQMYWYLLDEFDVLISSKSIIIDIYVRFAQSTWNIFGFVVSQ